MIQIREKAANFSVRYLKTLFGAHLLPGILSGHSLTKKSSECPLMLCFSITAMLILCSSWAANPGVTLEACAFQNDSAACPLRAPPSVNAYWLHFWGGECGTVKLCWTARVASMTRFRCN